MFSFIFLIWLFNQPYDAESLYDSLGDDLTLVSALILDGLLLWGIFNV